MSEESQKANHLIKEKSPYLLQHAYNPVDWYPWGEEAFTKAKKVDKPVFLSIGYSTCHWCHVMAHESFEDPETADYLNKYFISIKVDKEERPDIDSIYMTVCQAFTGSGGWPTSIFLTPDQKPFFAGTYFPKKKRYGMSTFMEILTAIHINWQSNRERLLQSATEVVQALKQQREESVSLPEEAEKLFADGEKYFRQSFDRVNGGFGMAPKFPTPHNLWFLLCRYERSKDQYLLAMVEKTLTQMYRGGLFDHIGYGFSRYSTDPYFLAPHFEKMLYDNALLLLVYSKAFVIMKKELYLQIAKKIATYILREMTDVEGGFYCAQDADIQGEEGKYYLFTPEEIETLLGKQAGKTFNQYYDITEDGNFEGKNIPNLLKNDVYGEEFSEYHKQVYEYRKNRYQLHLDDKILTSWNGLMIGAFCILYRVSKDNRYLIAAEKAQQFIEEKLCEEETLYVSYRKGRGRVKGFLEDYANYIFALLGLYDATLDAVYSKRAKTLCQKVIAQFWDEKNGGFFLYSKDHEALILRPKETYDGAMPSGNSMMAYNLVRLCALLGDTQRSLEQIKERHLAFMAAESKHGAANHTMFLLALDAEENPPEKIVVVPKEGEKEKLQKELPHTCSLESVIQILPKEEKGYPMLNGETTYYICKGNQCLPGSNTL